MHICMDSHVEHMIKLLRKTLHTRRLNQDWLHMARPNQREPEGAWRIWLILAGRGFGKTRTGAETIRKWVLEGRSRRVCLLGHTLYDAQHVMVEGISGLHSISRPQDRIRYTPHTHKLCWPNGARADCFSAESDHHLRGPQFDSAWIDELTKFSDPERTFHQLMFGLRLGTNPKVIITTTPTPCPFLRQLMRRSDVVVTRGTTFENAAHLSESYIENLKATYEGTRLGAQEIYGMVLEGDEDALWVTQNIQYTQTIPPLTHCIVALDPAVTHHKESAESGIIVVGRDAEGKGYVLQDYSGVFSPTQAVAKAVQAMNTHNAHAIVAEINNGGDFIQDLIKVNHPNVRYIPVRANKSKYARAQPIAALYEQKRIYHLACFPKLEEQMLTYTPKSTVSPDRLDALVWGLHTLFCSQKTLGIRQPKIWMV